MLHKVTKDKKILDYLEDLAQDAKLYWEIFYFLTTEKYINLKIQTKEKYGFEFLDRIEWINEKEIEYLGSVVGEYNGCLYVNLDKQYFCIPVDPQSIKLNNSGLTEFESVQSFQYQYLGFYLKVQDQYLLDDISLKNKLKNNLLPKLHRNEQFIENTQIILKTSDRIKHFTSNVNTANNLFYFNERNNEKKSSELLKSRKLEL